MVAPCDCDDDDVDVFPGQSDYFTSPRKNQPTGPKAYDYDCSGTSTFRYDIGGCGICDTSAVAEFFDPGSGQPDACAATGYRRYCAGIDVCQQDNTYTQLGCH